MITVSHVFLGIQQNLHIVLIMDSANMNFIINCESNPALHKKCQVLWMEGWSDSSMKKVCSVLTLSLLCSCPLPGCACCRLNFSLTEVLGISTMSDSMPVFFSFLDSLVEYRILGGNFKYKNFNRIKR